VNTVTGQDATDMGPLLCLISAAAFGAMAIFGKLAYEADVGVGDLLLVRFGLAAAVLVAIAWATGALRGLPRRAALTGLLMGGAGYAAQAGLFFLALERMDASILALLLYTYPAMVTVAAIVLGRERGTRRRAVALTLACSGTALVLVGAGAGALDPVATVMGVGAALTYTAYILVGDRLIGDTPPLALAALVTTGATATFSVVALATGGPELGFEASGWAALVAIALVSTVVAIVAFFAGLARVGPSAAAILSTLEPPVTVALAALAFGESLAPVQLVGGALVLSAVVLLQLPAGRPALGSRQSRAAAPV
jgi:drug/metabolite transporter (DMT)-like permease